MKKIRFYLKHYAFLWIFLLLTLAIFYPVFFRGQIPFSSNLLVSFYNPWIQEKFPGWEGGIPNKPVGIDDLRIFYPQRSFTMYTFSLGQLPLWNPYSFSGNSHIGLSETAVFYPLNVLFFILPQLSAWILFIMIQPFLVGVGMYLFLQRLLKDKKIAFFGGMVFAFSGIVIVRMVEGISDGHTLLWLPYTFWAIEAFFQNKRLRYVIVLILSLSFSLLAGWFQFTFYIAVTSFCYILWKLFVEKNQKKSLATTVIVLPYVVFPLLTLFHLIPAIQTLLLSPRSDFTQNLLQNHLMPFAHLVTFLFPDLWGNPGTYNFIGISEYKESIMYIGVVPFILALFSLKTIKKNKTIFFFSAATVIALLLGIKNPVSEFITSLPLPLLSTFLPNRIFVIASFSCSILAAYGLEVLLNKGIKRGYILGVLALIYIVLIVTPIVIYQTTYHRVYSQGESFMQTLHKILIDRIFVIQIKNVPIPGIFIVLFTLILFVYILTKKQKIFFTGIIILTYIGQFYFAQKYIPFSQKEFVFPRNPVFTYLQNHQGIHRFISIGSGYISSNIPLQYHLFSPDGVGSMYSKRYGELITYMQNNGHIGVIPRIETRIDPSAQQLFVDNNSYLLRFLQIDGVKYIVVLKNEMKSISSDRLSSGGFRVVWQNNTWEILEYNNTLPRFFWATKYMVLPNDKVLQTLFDQLHEPKDIVLEKSPDMTITKNATAHITLVSYTPNKIVFTIHANGNGLFYLSDAYSPQFGVLIDTKKVEMLRANYDFRAVVVPKGDHTITFFYDQSLENISFIVSGITVLGVILGIAFLHKKKIITL